MQPDNQTPAQVFRKRQASAARMQVSPEEQAMHEKSKTDYPLLSLSPGEYVLEVVRRHVIGLVAIWGFTAVLIFLILAIVPIYAMNIGFISQITSVAVAKLPSAATLAIPALIIAGFVLLGGAVAAWVYVQNKFYITTESIVQFVQYSLFSSKQQVVNLINVEDVSADQTGILQQILNYGTLRVSTQGQETIYHFRFVASPMNVVHNINDATEIAIQRLEGGNFPPSELAA